MWAKLQEGLDLDPPTKSWENTYLGCNQQVVTIQKSVVQSKTELLQRLLYPTPPVVPTETTTNAPQANIHSQTKHKHQPSSPKTTNSKNKSSMSESSPFQHTQHQECTNHIRNIQATASSSETHVKSWQYEMKGHAEQCVERYIALTGRKIESLLPVATPCMDDHQFRPEELVEKGEISDNAARIV